MARNLSRREPREYAAGHNSTGVIDGAGLKRFVDRVIALIENRKAINEDISEVIAEASESGFVGKQIRQLAREAMMEPEVLSDHLSQMDTLRHALGQYSNTPLGNAAMARAEGNA